jgi:hypothetical protein
MNNKIEVAKIDIKIGDKTISLKPEQAKELKKILNEMFEESVDKVIHEHRYWWNYPWYSNPYPHIYPQWTITCAGNATGYSSDVSSTLSNVMLSLNA